MKRKSIILFTVIYTLFLITAYGQSSNSEQAVIIIDPGHGGVDSGAIGVNGLLEKELTLQLAKSIAGYNKTLLNNRYTIYLTRYSDTLIALGDRTKLAKALRPAIFISLHCNHANNPKAKGLEIYLHNTPMPQSHITMAKQMEAYLKTKLGYQSRGVKRANFQVLRDNRNLCPALLLELGFLSHGDEAAHFEKEEKIRALGLAILMGIEKLGL